MDLIKKFTEIFKKNNIPVYLRPYEIIVASENSGFIGNFMINFSKKNINNLFFFCKEFLPNTLSIDALKKNVPNFKNLNDFYQRTFEDYFEEAQKNFIESLAGYSLISYLLQVTHTERRILRSF